MADVAGHPENVGMSLMGQNRKCQGSRGTSVLPSTADIVSPARHVRKVPKSGTDAALYITKLPKAGQQLKEWQTVVENLINAAVCTENLNSDVVTIKSAKDRI
jgi:hypothetical protein